MAVRAYVPEQLVGNVSDAEAYLLGAIRWQQATKQVKPRTGYAMLKMTYLRHVLGHRGAGRLIADCLARGLIRRDNSWWAGKESMGYKVGKDYARQPIVGIPLTDGELLSRLVCFRERRIAEAIGGDPVRQWVFDNLARLSMRGGFNAVLASHAGNLDKVNMRIQSVGRLEDRDWWFRPDPKSGRLYHNATTLPRDCRRLLLMDGLPTMETDIGNCQPFLLGATMYDGPSAERSRFMDMCIAGEFYDRLNALLPAPIADRDELKKTVYQNIMYGSSWHVQQAPFKAFERAWPILAAKVKATKYGAGGKSRLPVAMQGAEAEMMFGRVVPRLMNDLPEAKAVTIHDGLLLAAQYAQDAAWIIEEEFVKRYGVSPLVRVKSA